MVCLVFFFERYGDHRDLHVRTHSFPTRRSSDLEARPSPPPAPVTMATRPSKLIVRMNSQSRGPDGLPMKTGPSLAVRGALARVNEIAACHRNVTQKTCNCHLPVLTVPPDC